MGNAWQDVGPCQVLLTPPRVALKGNLGRDVPPRSSNPNLVYDKNSSFANYCLRQETLLHDLDSNSLFETNTMEFD